MANETVGYGISLQDYRGVRGSMQLVQSIVDTTTLATIATTLQTLETTLDAVTGAAIIDGRATIRPGLVAGLKTAVAGADLEKTLLINFAQTGLAGRYGVDIPGVNPTVVPGDVIDPTQVAIAALVALIEGNYASAALKAIPAVRDYVLTFRKRRRELNRATFVAG